MRIGAMLLVVLLLGSLLSDAETAGGVDQLGDSFFDALNHPSIAYGTRTASDPVSRLNRSLRAGEVQLGFDKTNGYLRSLLDALRVPIESQMAVFSKTSLQAGLIGPQNPRTIFFNDSVVVAWPRGGFIEVAAQDPEQGVHFYALEQTETAAPQLASLRVCLACHHSYATVGVPGMLVRSIVTGADGRTVPRLGNSTSDHRTPLEERWGGWYVTGKLGPERHLGNTLVSDTRDVAESIPVPGSPPGSLEGRFDLNAYLSPYSDIVALLVFEHQMRMMNLLTRVGWEVRLAVSDTSRDRARVIRETAHELVDYLLFVEEAPLGRVEGTSGYRERFASQGPHDSRGRSLRQLDLDGRLMRYTCSYMIYSAAFDGLPVEAREAVYRRLWEVLSGQEQSAKYARLSLADRRAIVEILRETKKDLPDYFRPIGQ